MTILAFTDLINLECTRYIAQPLSRKRVLETVSALVAHQLNLTHQTVFDALLARERLGSTAIGAGIAMPHGKLNADTTRTIGVLLHLATPIEFNAPDNQPVDLLLALLIPDEQCPTHLQTLSLLADRLADKTLCRKLRSTENDADLYQILLDSDQNLSSNKQDPVNLE